MENGINFFQPKEGEKINIKIIEPNTYHFPIHQIKSKNFKNIVCIGKRSCSICKYIRKEKNKALRKKLIKKMFSIPANLFDFIKTQTTRKQQNGKRNHGRQV